MPEYAVHLTTDVASVTEDQLDSLVDGLIKRAAAVGFEDGRLTAQMTVSAMDFPGAVQDGGTDLLAELAMMDIAAEVVAVEVRTAEEFDRWLTRPQRPEDLVSTAEVAGILGVSRQRVLQLAETHEDFPSAVRVGSAMLRSGSAVRRFAAEWKRTPGPPPQDDLPPDRNSAATG